MIFIGNSSATITYRTQSTNTYTSSFNPLTTGVSGDLCIICVGGIATSAGASATNNTPSGWTLVGSHNYSTTYISSIFMKVLTESDTSVRFLTISGTAYGCINQLLFTSTVSAYTTGGVGGFTNTGSTNITGTGLTTPLLHIGSTFTTSQYVGYPSLASFTLSNAADQTALTQIIGGAYNLQLKSGFHLFSSSPSDTTFSFTVPSSTSSFSVGCYIGKS